jgi:hypothetical protein
MHFERIQGIFLNPFVRDQLVFSLFIALHLVFVFFLSIVILYFHMLLNLCRFLPLFSSGCLAKRSDGAVEEVNLLVENCKCSF